MGIVNDSFLDFADITSVHSTLNPRSSAIHFCCITALHTRNQQCARLRRQE